MTKKRTLLISTLASALPVGKSLLNIYPVPMQLGETAHSSYDPYWGAIDAMMLDDEIAGDIELRKSVAISMPWRWVGSDESIANTQMLLSNIDMNDLFMCSLSHLEYGFNALEVEWSNESGVVMPVSISRRIPSLFRIQHDGELLYSGGSWPGTVVPRGKVIIIARNASRDRPYGESILEAAWPIWQVKWSHIASLDRLGEKYAVPSVVALSKTVTDQSKLNMISEALASLESGAGVALGGIDSVIALNSSGKATELLAVIKHYDNKLCKLISGQTLSTGNAANGSRALGEVFERATLRLSASDLKVVLRALNETLIKWLAELNPTLDIAHFEFDEEAFKAVLGQAPALSAVTLSNVPDEDLLLCL